MTAPDGGRRTAPGIGDFGFGAATLIAALLALLVWIPLDIKGGFVELNRAGRLEPGDAFFPGLLAATLLLLGLVQLAVAAVRRWRGRAQRAPGAITMANLAFLARFLAIVLTGLALMYGFGPLTVAALKAVGLLEQSYRQLIDTVPYKYLGYLLGGGVLGLGLIAWAEGRVRRAAVLAVILVLATAVAIFDVLLTNIPLPPNADF